MSSVTDDNEQCKPQEITPARELGFLIENQLLPILFVALPLNLCLQANNPSSYAGYNQGGGGEGGYLTHV